MECQEASGRYAAIRSACRLESAPLLREVIESKKRFENESRSDPCDGRRP
jgi:hypothetical protein